MLILGSSESAIAFSFLRCVCYLSACDFVLLCVCLCDIMAYLHRLLSVSWSPTFGAKMKVRASDT